MKEFVRAYFQPAKTGEKQKCRKYVFKWKKKENEAEDVKIGRKKNKGKETPEKTQPAD